MPAAVGRNMREKLIVRLEVYSELKEVNDVNRDNNLPTDYYKEGKDPWS